MNAEDLLRSYKLNIASISYLTKENKSIEVLLQSLAEKEREILVLTYIHKVSLAVIQNRTGANINEIKSTNRSSIDKLNKVINNNSKEAKNVIDFIEKYVINIDTIAYLTSLNTMIDNVLEMLDPMEKKIIILRYFEEMMLYEISNRVQYSLRSIYAIRKSALDKINRIINVEHRREDSSVQEI